MIPLLAFVAVHSRLERVAVRQRLMETLCFNVTLSSPEEPGSGFGPTTPVSRKRSVWSLL